jgi:hypothetical protein
MLLAWKHGISDTDGLRLLFALWTSRAVRELIKRRFSSL